MGRLTEAAQNTAFKAAEIGAGVFNRVTEGPVGDTAATLRRGVEAAGDGLRSTAEKGREKLGELRERSRRYGRRAADNLKDPQTQAELLAAGTAVVVAIGELARLLAEERHPDHLLEKPSTPSDQSNS